MATTSVPITVHNIVKASKAEKVSRKKRPPAAAAMNGRNASTRITRLAPRIWRETSHVKSPTTTPTKEDAQSASIDLRVSAPKPDPMLAVADAIATKKNVPTRHLKRFKEKAEPFQCVSHKMTPITAKRDDPRAALIAKEALATALAPPWIATAEATTAPAPPRPDLTATRAPSDAATPPLRHFRQRPTRSRRHLGSIDSGAASIVGRRSVNSLAAMPVQP
mmetsp:Transcript_57720/g.160889  ORF Transcript_57720/g.160889 Transcript_57720/m.160889 type:complete len:221 (-) Transcript_57720:98-760(-)